ncbi:transcription factor DIVARICATA-like [Phragmites australis]|uniref:transcription factor DIVARICATA-like n=1 Tax=Phragmites australis TaxID=29695 RepID=UPI002D76D858|nr:transcription factor DIVARICATA-like [Phragmites australis]
MREAYMEVLPPMQHYASRSNWFLAAARSWTSEENKQFERALAGVDLRCPDWEKVARAIPGRTVGEVVSHFKNLEVDVQQIESGMVPFVYGGGGANSFTLQWDGNGGHGTGDFRHGYRFGGGCGKRHPGRTPEQERKKGVPWTEEEHKLFLLGLKKYGKGDWRNISRNFVQTRTPTQVASHAQKYFIRLNSGGKDKRRSSIHDITTVSLTDDRPPSPSQSSLITNQSNASAPTAAVGQFSLTADAKQHGAVNLPFNSPGRTPGMPTYGMGMQDQGLQCGPLHDQLVGNLSMLF